jgi:hypothetical protein
MAILHLHLLTLRFDLKKWHKRVSSAIFSLSLFSHNHTSTFIQINSKRERHGLQNHPKQDVPRQWASWERPHSHRSRQPGRGTQEYPKVRGIDWLLPPPSPHTREQWPTLLDQLGKESILLPYWDLPPQGAWEPSRNCVECQGNWKENPLRCVGSFVVFDFCHGWVLGRCRQDGKSLYSNI